MRAALIGYGKMGKAMEQIAPSLGISIVSRVDPTAEQADFTKLCDAAVSD